MNSNTVNNALEPRRDLPLHKIPELLAKITGTISSTISSSSTEVRFISSSIDRYEQLFENYSDRNGLMTIDGILQWCQDLNVEPDSYEVLLFCFLCRAKQMYSLNKNEFLLGLKTLGHQIDKIVDIRHKLFNFDVLPYENEFYNWTFSYGLIDGQRCLTTNNAISLWRLFYSKQIQKPLILDRWLEYLNDDLVNDIPKTITCDTWKIFPQFSKFIEVNGFDIYDENEAWPALFDGFVEFEKNSTEKFSSLTMTKRADNRTCLDKSND